MKVLVIDDQPEALKQIEKALVSAEGPDGRPYAVVAMADHHAASKRLETEHFDVVITDMVMGTEEDEGLEVLRELAGKSPITIVLTAYPSIPNSVEAMRAGAWDYLEKVPADGGDAYENLLRSLRQAYEYRRANPEAGWSNPDSTWVRQQFAELVREFAGEMVAVVDRQVVDHDKSYRTLLDRVREKYPLARPTIVSLPDTSVEAVE
jgi:DNA-binding NtrC family response regulator